jgi:uncharacterized membrane protein SirB2
MMSYLLLKNLHIGCVMPSAALASCCVVCGCWPTPPGCSERAVRVLPHLVDTILLAVRSPWPMLSGQYPFAPNWLTAKLVGLLIYIGCGTMALKRAPSKAQRAVFLVAALTAFAYIVTVALTRSPYGLIAGLV